VTASTRDSQRGDGFACGFPVRRQQDLEFAGLHPGQPFQQILEVGIWLVAYDRIYKPEHVTDLDSGAIAGGGRGGLLAAPVAAAGRRETDAGLTRTEYPEPRAARNLQMVPRKRPCS